MTELTWVNGLPSECVSVADRGLQYGDGVFETIRIRDGVARFLPLHLQRLSASCDRLGIGPLNLQEIATEISDAAARIVQGIGKLIVTRGVAVQRGYAAQGAIRPTRILSITAAVAALPAAARIDFSHVTLNENPLLAGIKHLNRLENVLARSSIAEGVDEVLMCGAAGHVVCGSMSNLFLRRKQQLLTPRLNRSGVAGIMRQVVIREAAAQGWHTQEVDVGRADLINATEIFLTNVRVGVWPVCEIAGRKLTTGELTTQLAAVIEGLDGSR